MAYSAKRNESCIGGGNNRDGAVNVISTGYYDIDKSKMTGAVEVVTAREIAGKGYTS
ncbi:MAG: hypothetical protein ACLU30_17290 [Odoribacter splanchnicus]